jgi:hypothetical protein
MSWLWIETGGDTVPGCSSYALCVVLLINYCVYSSNINFCVVSSAPKMFLQSRLCVFYLPCQLHAPHILMHELYFADLFGDAKTPKRFE